MRSSPPSTLSRSSVRRPRGRHLRRISRLQARVGAATAPDRVIRLSILPRTGRPSSSARSRGFKVRSQSGRCLDQSPPSRQPRGRARGQRKSQQVLRPSAQCADCNALREYSTRGPLFGPRNASSAMPNFYRVRFHAAGHRPRLRSPFWVPLVGGLGCCYESPVPALSTGTGYFRRSSRGPRRVEGLGKCAGGNAGLISGESASAARQQKQRC